MQKKLGKIHIVSNLNTLSYAKQISFLLSSFTRTRSLNQNYIPSRKKIFFSRKRSNIAHHSDPVGQRRVTTVGKEVRKSSVPNRNLNTCNHDVIDASSLGFLVYSNRAIALAQLNVKARCCYTQFHEGILSFRDRTTAFPRARRNNIRFENIGKAVDLLITIETVRCIRIGNIGIARITTRSGNNDDNIRPFSSSRARSIQPSDSSH